MDNIFGENFAEIVKNIDVNKLIKPLNSCPEFRRIFSHNIYPKPFDFLIEESDETKRQFIEQCLRKNAAQFAHILLHTNQNFAAVNIDPTVIDIIDSSRLDPKNGNLITQCQHIDTDPRNDILIPYESENSAQNSKNIFAMHKSPRGYCLMINNYLTYGSFKEMQRFRNIFYQLHFEVILVNNLSAAKIWEMLKNLSLKISLAPNGEHEAFVCIIISHGTGKSEILGFDDGHGEQPIDIKMMCDLFNDENCPKLFRRPRLFLFNCCRGEVEDSDESGQRLAAAYNSDIIQFKLPEIPDFLICYSTLSGHNAYVDWNAGTEFGKVLSQSLVEKASSRDINSIFTRTNNYLQRKQPFAWVQSLTSDLYFKPFDPYIIELQC